MQLLAAPRALVDRTAVVSLLTTAVLGLHYAGRDGPDGLDSALRRSAVLRWFTDRPALALEIVHVGAPLAVATTTGLLAIVHLALGRYRWAALTVLGVGVPSAAATVLKPLIGRTYDGVATFPSGHTSAITAIGLVTAMLLMSAVAERRPLVSALTAVGVLAMALIGATLMAVALVAIGAHFPTDAIGGFLLAVTCVIGIAALLDRMPERMAVLPGRPRRPS